MSGIDTSVKPLHSSADLNKEYLENAVKKYFGNDEIHVISFEMTSPTEREGFLSEIVFLKVKFIPSSGKREESLSLVAKFLPCDEERFAMMRMLNLHGREVEAYRYLNSPFPKSVCVGLDKKLVVPPLIAAAFKEDALTLILEDLGARGYRTKSSVEGSSVEQTITVFRSIALVHAVGVIDMEKNGKIGSVTPSNAEELLSQFLTPNIKMLVEMFKDTPDEEVFLKISENSELLPQLAKKYEFITTITHSDLWASNALFDADDQNCAIIDWQFACLGNTVCDLQTMFFMSCNLEILENQDLFMKVLNAYWSQFTATLSNHGVAVKKTFQDFEQCVRDTFMYGFAFMVASANALIACKKTSKDRLARCVAFMRDSGAWDKFLAVCAQGK